MIGVRLESLTYCSTRTGRIMATHVRHAVSTIATLFGVGISMIGVVRSDETTSCVRIGHRGAPTLAPENTLAGVREAIKVGVDGIEFDVKFTADHKMIVIHDGDLKRTTNGGDAKVADKTLAELRQLDAGSWGPWANGQFPGEKLPLPEEIVHEIVASGAFPVVHIAEAGLVSDVVRVLAAEKALDRAVIFCFGYDAMEKLVTECPQVRKGWLVEKSNFEKDGIEGVVAKALRAKCSILAPAGSAVTPELMAACRQANLPLWVWTINEQAQMEQAIGVGVDGIITDAPQLLNAVLAGPKAPKSPGVRP